MKAKLRGLAAGSAVFCLLLAAYSAPVRAVLANGLLRITALYTTSGGGTAAGGPLALNAANIGGLTASGARLTNGNLSVTAGVTPAVVTFAAAEEGELAPSHCYPVPFKPSAGHTKITFTNLTGAARIRIYTISGELVRTLDKAGSGKTLDWDARNERGSAADSGVYLWHIKSAAQEKKGKLMIIR